MMNQYIVLIITALLSQLSFAGIYKCEENGRVSYSEKQCADNAQVIQVNTQNRLITDKNESAMDRNTKVDDYSKTLEASRLTRQYQREISTNKESISKNSKILKDKLAKIQAIERHRRSVHTVQEFNQLKKAEIALLKLKTEKKIQKLNDDIESKKKAILKLKQLKK